MGEAREWRDGGIKISGMTAILSRCNWVWQFIYEMRRN